MNTDKKKIIKSFVSVYLPAAGLVLIISWGIYHFHHVKTRQEILFAHERQTLALEKTLIRYIFKSIVSDINIMAEKLNLVNYRFEDPGVSDRLTKEFIPFSRFKGTYDQIRVLGPKGMERIRVDLANKTPYVVPKKDLQFKGKRYYFKDTINLNRGEIFMSPLDLNIENGQIQLPLKPMIRFGTPLWNKEGEKQGVIILNYLGSNLIQNLEEVSSLSAGQLLMTNAKGYWLKGMTAEDEWGFMIEERRDKKIQTAFPKVWQALQVQDQGQIMTPNGLFTFEKVFLLDSFIHSSTGAPQPDEPSRCLLSNKDFYWVILSRITPEQIHNPDAQFLKNLIYIDLLFLLLLGGLLWELVKSNSRRDQAERSLKTSNRRLEQIVAQRTRELSETNQDLKKEIIEHKKSIRQRIEAESRLRQAQKMEAIGSLAGGIAHDFNNILTPILGYSEMIKSNLDPGDPLTQDINKIITASGRAKELVQQILTFSRQTEQKLVPLKLHSVIQEALKLLRSSIPSTINIQKNIDMECRPVLADPIHIHQIIMNLCTNAYHAMRENGGTLGISLSETIIEPHQTEFSPLHSGSYARLKIEDTGKGIPAHLLDKIFEPYFTTKKEGEGTGLGLAVIHSIIQSLHGGIFVKSTPGKGTLFQVFIPIPDQLPVSPGAQGNPEQKLSGTERILIVDDDNSVIDVEARILRDLGYQVTETQSSQTALEIFQADPDRFDLVITDMTMPDMTGQDLIQKLRALRPDIKIILGTGLDDTQPKKEPLSDINGFFNKPVSLSAFATTVRQVLDQTKPAPS